MTPEELITMINGLSKAMDSQLKVTGEHIFFLRLYLEEYGEEGMRRYLKEEKGIERLPFDLTVREYIVVLENLGRPR